MSYTYDYPRPALTVDCVVFGLDEEDLKAGFSLDYRLYNSAINEILNVTKNMKDDAFAQEMEALLGPYKPQAAPQD